MSPNHLVLDACVMMSGVLRPLLLTMAREGWYEPVWSDRIGSEWQRNAARIWPVAAELLEQEWEQMQSLFPQANSTVWPNNLILTPTTVSPPLEYSDPKDWHVVMTGIQAKQRSPDSDVTIVTWNIKDFRRSELRKHGLNLTDPDRLLCQWWQTRSLDLGAHLQRTITTLIDSGRRRAEPLEVFLKRERLFKLRRLYQTSPLAVSP